MSVIRTLFGTKTNGSIFTPQMLVALVSSGILAWGIGSITINGVTAQALPTKIAVIDVQKVVGQSNYGKASYSKVKQLQDDRLAKARQMDSELSALEGELNKPATTQAQRETLARQISDKRVAMKRFAEDADKEVVEARNRELVTLNARLTPVIESLAKEMALAGVFNKYESGLIYSADAIDITDTVISRFNAASPGQPAPATTRPATQQPASRPQATPQPTRRP
jgi:Skp family chaperone for outer membrane proteins